MELFGAGEQRRQGEAVGVLQLPSPPLSGIPFAVRAVAPQHEPCVDERCKMAAQGRSRHPMSTQAGLSFEQAPPFSLPLQFFVQGMPPGLTFSYDPNYLNGVGAAYIYGTLPPAAAGGSPYNVTLTATDGLDSASVTFTWQVTSNNPPPALPGDYGGDHSVDAGDYVLWRKEMSYSTAKYNAYSIAFLGADGNLNNQVEAGDYTYWRSQFGRTLSGSGAGSDLGSSGVPEPASISLLLSGMYCWMLARRRRS